MYTYMYAWFPFGHTRCLGLRSVAVSSSLLVSPSSTVGLAGAAARTPQPLNHDAGSEKL